MGLPGTAVTLTWAKQLMVVHCCGYSESCWQTGNTLNSLVPVHQGKMGKMRYLSSHLPFVPNTSAEFPPLTLTFLSLSLTKAVQAQHTRSSSTLHDLLLPLSLNLQAALQIGLPFQKGVI